MEWLFEKKDDKRKAKVKDHPERKQKAAENILFIVMVRLPQSDRSREINKGDFSLSRFVGVCHKIHEKLNLNITATPTWCFCKSFERFADVPFPLDLV